jgi:molybdopterin converting factor small subunit
MNNKTKTYLIAGSLIIGILLLLLGINYITGQKNNKKPVKPISATNNTNVVETTTVLNTNKSISVSKTIKENSSSSTKSSSSKATSSSSSSESSSSQISSSSVNADSELDSRLQWKEDCKLVTGLVKEDTKIQRTSLGDGREIIIVPCVAGQSLVYYYEVALNGRWLSQRQVFWNNSPTISSTTLTSTTLTGYGKFRTIGECGILSKYEFNTNTKAFDPIKIQELKEEFCQSNIPKEEWPIIYEKK